MARMIELKTSEITVHQHRLTIFQKMILGALGALTPVLLNLYAVDFEKLFMNQEITVPYLIGYVVRILILILYGSLIAFFHRDEHNPVKLFQLGIAFPAIVTILLSGANQRQIQYQTPQTNTNTQQTPSVGLNAATSVYRAVFAQYQQPVQPIEPIKVNEFDTVRPSPFVQFLQGFLGTMPQNNTFAVLIGGEMAWYDALNDYQFYSHNYPNFKVQLYYSYENKNKYILVLGSNLTEAEAVQLQTTAHRNGLLTTTVDLRKTN